MTDITKQALEAAHAHILDAYRVWQADDISAIPPSGSSAGKALALISAALSRPIDPKAEVEPVGYVHDIDGPLPVFSKEAPTDRSWLSLGVDVTTVYASPSIVAPVDGWQLVPKDDDTRDFSNSKIPVAMIDAGAIALEKASDDLRNYVAGETIDWDYGMQAVAVYRAMLAAAPAPTPAEKAGVGYGDAELATKLQAAYDLVKFFPENNDTGFMDLLALRNLVPEAIRALSTKPEQEDGWRETLEQIDRKAEAGLCYFTVGSVRAFHEDIRAIVKQALSTTKSAQGDGE